MGNNLKALSAIVSGSYTLLTFEHLDKIAVIIKAAVHGYIDELFVGAHDLLTGRFYSVIIEVFYRRLLSVFLKSTAEIVSVHAALIGKLF